MGMVPPSWGPLPIARCCKYGALNQFECLWNERNLYILPLKIYYLHLSHPSSIRVNVLRHVHRVVKEERPKLSIRKVNLPSVSTQLGTLRVLHLNTLMCQIM